MCRVAGNSVFVRRILVGAGVEFLPAAGDVGADDAVGDLGGGFVQEPFPDPPDGVALVGWPGSVLEQDRVDGVCVGIHLGRAGR